MPTAMPIKTNFLLSDRRRTLLALFLALNFLVGCSPCNLQWESEVIKADYPPITYAKIYLPVCSTFKGIEAEFLFCNQDAQLFLNIFSLEFPDYTDSGYFEVKLRIDDQEYCYWAERFEGGQKLLLCDDATQLVISTLLVNCSIELSAGRYQAKLIPENFAKIYYEVTSPKRFQL